MTEASTIFALSSGAPPAAIGVIRVSGPRSGAALVAMHGRLPEPRRATLGWLRDPATGERIDRALLLWLPGPHSATGEDLAELHVHGGRAVTAAVLAALGSLDELRPAEGGEFTRRAFEHGMIDLAQAEGLADLIAAETDVQRRSAQHHAGGLLSRRVAAWQERILSLSAQVEAILDFGNEQDVAPDDAPVRREIDALANQMAELKQAVPTERLREGIRVVLAGPPNAGKSTLLNAVVGRAAAITAATAGTTRDVIEAPLAIAGVPFLFVDTAGLRDEGDAVERIGIARAHAAVERADILLWLGDADAAPDHARRLILHPRCDQFGRGRKPDQVDIAVSAVTGAGVAELLGVIARLGKALLPAASDVTLDMRQRDVVTMCHARLREASRCDDLVLVAELLRSARQALDRLTGRAGVEEMLDALFCRFCIGK